MIVLQVLRQANGEPDYQFEEVAIGMCDGRRGHLAVKLAPVGSELAGKMVNPHTVPFRVDDTDALKAELSERDKEIRMSRDRMSLKDKMIAEKESKIEEQEKKIEELEKLLEQLRVHGTA